MIFTGRPSSPPFLLVSSSQILAPSSACLPLAASGPVRAIEKPTLTGSPDGAWAAAGTVNAAIAAVAKNEATTPRRFSCASMVSSSWLALNSRSGILGGPWLAILGMNCRGNRSGFSPYLVCDFDDHPQLRPLHVL